MFSKSCEYAIKASIYIAQQSSQTPSVNVKEVAAAVNAPVAFMAKILQQLCREGILHSIRGKQGGFVFEEEKQREVTLFRMVEIFDGDGLFTKCGLGLQKCSSKNPCPLHDDFLVVRRNLVMMTQKYNFHDLALRTQNGLAWLK